MRKHIIKTTIVSIGLLLSQQAWASVGADAIKETGANYSHQEMAEILTKAKEEVPPRFPIDGYVPKHKKYKEDSNESFSWWEERIYKDLTRNYKKLFTQNISPNIDAVINATDLTPNEKVASLLDIQSQYKEKAALAVWNNLISKRPDSKNARSAFCKVAAETVSIAGRNIDERNGEICDKDFQLDPNHNFMWKKNKTPEVIQSVIIAPQIKINIIKYLILMLPKPSLLINLPNQQTKKKRGKTHLLSKYITNKQTADWLSLPTD